MIFLSSTTSIIFTAWRALCGLLDVALYGFIIILYQLFDKLTNAQVINNSVVQGIYSRVGLILGIYMLFRLTFSFIQMVVDPDRITDKEKGVGNIVKKTVIVVVLFAVTPTLFTEAYKIQELLIKDENVLSKVILGKSSADSSEFGVDLASTVFFSFYTRNPESVNYTEEDFESLRNEVIQGKNFSPIMGELADDEGFTGYKIEFDGLFSVIVGGFICWILITYCVSIGLRVIQLAFLQLIAPIPILSYLSSSKEGTFQKWVKQCVTTYLDLFIRMAIIYFAVLMISVIIGGTTTNVYRNVENYNSNLVAKNEIKNNTVSLMNFNNNAYHDNSPIFVDLAIGNSDSIISESTGVATTDKLFVWIKIVLIMGLLMFAKKAPELIKELLPSSGAAGGDFSLSLKNREPLKRGISAVAGLATGTAVGFIGGKGAAGKLRGALGGAAKGAYGGFTSKDGIVKNMSGTFSKQSAQNKKYATLIDDGGTAVGAAVAGVQSKFGMKTAADRDKEKLAKMKYFTDSYKALDSRAMDKALEKNINGIADLKNRADTLRSSASGINFDSVRSEMIDSVSESSVQAELEKYKTPKKDANGRAIIGQYEYSITAEEAKRIVVQREVTTERVQQVLNQRQEELNAQIYAADNAFSNAKKEAKVTYINQTLTDPDSTDIETKRLAVHIDAGIDKYGDVAKEYNLEKVGNGSLTKDKYSRHGDMSTRTAEFETFDEFSKNKANTEYNGKK